MKTKKKNIKLTESMLRKMIKESIKQYSENHGPVNAEHEKQLRRIVGYYAEKIANIAHEMTMHHYGERNYLAEFLSNEKWVDTLYDVIAEMKDFATANDEVDEYWEN